MHDRIDSGQSRVRKAIEAASRRSKLVVFVESSAFTLTAVLAGFVFLLLLGTQILNWPWLVLLTVAGFAVTMIRVRGQILSRYRVAQIVDRKLALNDSLSTAWFLLEDSGSRQDPFACEQIDRAAKVAAAVDPGSVFPFVWRKTWALTGALAAVAFGLFALRYLVLSRLDFKQALIANPMSYPAEVLDYLQKHSTELQPDSAALNGAHMIPERLSDSKQNEQTGDKNAPGQPRDKDVDSGDKLAANNGQRWDNHAEAINSSADRKADAQRGSDNETSGQTGEKQDASLNGQTPSQAKQDENRQSSSSLMDRMREALSGLMAKMAPQTAEQKGAENPNQDGKPSQQNAQNDSKNAQSGQSPQNFQQTQAESPQQNAQGQQAAQASEKSPVAMSHTADQSASSKGSNAQSGIGRQDGEKTLKEADQLRAMGKLNEIIGKRSSSLTGDMTVETHSSREQLRTQYSGRIGQHSDLGGEINRDEVPVALQQYVRDYMEEVRKQANNQP